MDAAQRLADKLSVLPLRPGVYLLKDEHGGVLYVGKARVLRDRVRSYFQAGRPIEPQKQKMLSEIADLDLILTDTEIEALALENSLIKQHHPPYNVLLRDDKNHPYLRLSLAETYPRLSVVRRVSEDGNAYGGPYIPAALSRRTAALVHRVFGVRSCREQLDGSRPRPCLQYQIKRCLAPCVASICDLSRYRQACEDARLFLEGRSAELVRRLKSEMEAASAALRFEEAASLRNQLRAIEELDTPQKVTTVELEERDLFGIYEADGRAALQVFAVRDGKVVGREAFLLEDLLEPEQALGAALQQYYASGRHIPREVLVSLDLPEMQLLSAWLSERRGTRVSVRMPRRGEKVRLLELVVSNARLAYDLEWRHPRRQTQAILRDLRDLLGLEVEPRRIECFDISNVQGSDTVASLIAFEDGLPKKSAYRRFHVRGTQGLPDDLASMREVVGRRYRRLLEQGQDLPDLVLIDGGLGQLRAALAALEALGLGDLPVASLAKKEELIFLPERAAPIALPRSAPVLQLMQTIRDEAHRFAVTFHRAVRARRTLGSALDDVPTIGAVRRRKLLRRFGSLKGVLAASAEELAAVVGPKSAALIIRHLRTRDTATEDAL
jgi:excinuclease ABC subunit C